MSGGVGPASDITPSAKLDLSEPETKKHFHAPPSHRSNFLTFRQLNALAIITILSFSGLIGIEDSSFVLFSVFYIYFIAKVAFPPATSSASLSLPDNKLLTLYVSLGAIIGLFLPIAYIFEGIFEGDKEGIKAAAPHVFLLASQIFMEGVAGWAGYSLPIRVIVPIVYNGMRMFSLLEWVRSEVTKDVFRAGSKGIGGMGGSGEMEGGSWRRLYVGRGLAVANMGYWSFNLFGFLLPFYLPKAFKMYYGSKENKENSSSIGKNDGNKLAKFKE